MEVKNKKIIKIAIISIIAFFIVAFITFLMLKYNIEGEKNMPFNLEKITVISTAEGLQRDGADTKWNLEIIQKSDVYFQIEKNENFKKEDYINKIYFENFKIIERPLKGDIKFYKPNTDGLLYKYEEGFEITDRLEYSSALSTNLKEYKIANQGGNIGLSIAIRNLGEYVSNEDEEITHDGTILKKTDATMENIKAKVSFDIIIETMAERKYKANVVINLPVGDIITEGTASEEYTNFVFKRF